MVDADGAVTWARGARPEPRHRRASRAPRPGPGRDALQRRRGPLVPRGRHLLHDQGRQAGLGLRPAARRRSRSIYDGAHTPGAALNARRQRDGLAVRRRLRLRGRRQHGDLPDHARPRGRAVPAARSAPTTTDSEMTGVVFDPSGTRMYFSSQRAYPLASPTARPGSPLGRDLRGDRPVPPAARAACPTSWVFGPPAGEARGTCRPPAAAVAARRTAAGVRRDASSWPNARSSTSSCAPATCAPSAGTAAAPDRPVAVTLATRAGVAGRRPHTVLLLPCRPPRTRPAARR